MCRIHSLLTQAENPALTVNPITNHNSNEGLNYARCAPVLPKLDSCPAEKTYFTQSNMSLLPNSSTVSQPKQTDSWVESFVDLSEFCYPTITHTKMADSGDELNTPTISSTVQHRGFGNLSNVNENLRNLSDDNKWYGPNSVFIQEELPDPIADWLTTPKESIALISTADSLLQMESSSSSVMESSNNNNNDNRNNVNDILLDHRMLLSVTDDINHYGYGNNLDYKIKNDPLLSSALASPPRTLQPDSTFTTQTIGNNTHSPQNMPPYISFKPKLNVSAAVPMSSVVYTTASSPNNVQSPSISQSHLNLDESQTEFKIPSPGLVKRRNVKLDLKFGDSPFNPPCSMNTPEVLKPLVDKDLEFDLVSYVFEDNKPTKILSTDITTETIVPHHRTEQYAQQRTLLDSRLLDIPIKSEPPDIDDVVIAKTEEHDDGVCDQAIIIDDNNDYGRNIKEVIVVEQDDNELMTDNVRFEKNNPSTSNNQLTVTTDCDVGSGTAAAAATLLSCVSPRIGRNNDSNNIIAIKRKYEDTEEDEDENEVEEMFRSTGSRRTGLKIMSSNGNTSSSSNNSISSSGKDDKRRLSISDIALLESEKYRELRDRNNEASRRSRANRKTREVELQKQADILETENRTLKLRAERMEQLVKRLRETVLKMVRQKNRIPRD